MLSKNNRLWLIAEGDLPADSILLVIEANSNFGQVAEEIIDFEPKSPEIVKNYDPDTRTAILYKPGNKITLSAPEKVKKLIPTWSGKTCGEPDGCKIITLNFDHWEIIDVEIAEIEGYPESLTEKVISFTHNNHAKAIAWYVGEEEDCIEGYICAEDYSCVADYTCTGTHICPFNFICTSEDICTPEFICTRTHDCSAIHTCGPPQNVCGEDHICNVNHQCLENHNCTVDHTCVTHHTCTIEVVCTGDHICIDEHTCEVDHVCTGGLTCTGIHICSGDLICEIAVLCYDEVVCEGNYIEPPPPPPPIHVFEIPWQGYNVLVEVEGQHPRCQWTIYNDNILMQTVFGKNVEFELVSDVEQWSSLDDEASLIDHVLKIEYLGWEIP